MILRRFCLLLAVFAWTLGVASGQTIAPELKQQTLDRLQQAVATQAFVPGIDFSQWPSFVQRYRTDLDQAQDVPTFVAAVNKALREFGVSHIRLLSPQAARARATGEQLGFGVSVEPNAQGLEVTGIAPASPAARLGLEQGDLIIEVEGNKSPRTLSSIVGGVERDTVLVTVLRPRTGEQRHCMLLKGKFSTVRPPALEWPSPEVAVLKLSSFSRGYDAPAIEDMVRKATGAKALVLDLRGNPGGLVANLNHLLSLLTPPGTPIGTNVSRAMAERYAAVTAGDAKDMAAIARWNGPTVRSRRLSISPYPGRIAVLLDRRSASSSEIVAAVLHEKRGAILVGKPTAGAVLVSVYAGLGDGFEVQIPRSDYVTPNGVRLEKNPLQPDIRIDEMPHDRTDPALNAAIAALINKSQPLVSTSYLSTSIQTLTTVSRLLSVLVPRSH